MALNLVGISRSNCLFGLVDDSRFYKKNLEGGRSKIVSDTVEQKSNRTIEEETRRRRTFAIIAHPDAGKTTLTEKLLLYGGAIQLAGAVKARKKSKGCYFRLDGDGKRKRNFYYFRSASV